MFQSTNQHWNIRMELVFHTTSGASRSRLPSTYLSVVTVYIILLRMGNIQCSLSFPHVIYWRCIFPWLLWIPHLANTVQWISSRKLSLPDRDFPLAHHWVPIDVPSRQQKTYYHPPQKKERGKTTLNIDYSQGQTLASRSVNQYAQ